MKNLFSVKSSFVFGLRLSVVLLILWVGWGSVASVSGLFRLERNDPKAGPIASGADRFNPFPIEAVALTDGHWIFAGLPFTLDLTGTDKSFLNATKELVAQCSVDTGFVGVPLRNAHAQLLTEMQQFGARISSCSSDTKLLVYTINGVHFSVLYRVNLTSTNLIGAVVSVPGSGSNLPRTYRLSPVSSNTEEQRLVDDPSAVHVVQRISGEGFCVLDAAIVNRDSAFFRSVNRNPTAGSHNGFHFIGSRTVKNGSADYYAISMSSNGQQIVIAVSSELGSAEKGSRE